MDYEIGADESVSTAVIRAVSAVEGEELESLPPLAGVVDPDALNELFEARNGRRPRTGGRLCIVYSNSKVMVDNGEYVTIELLDPPEGGEGGRAGGAVGDQ